MSSTIQHSTIRYKLYNTTSKLHKSASSVGLIKKALHHKVTPKFAQINGQFINKQDQIDAEQKLMLSHLNRHVLTLNELIHKPSQLNNNLLEQVCRFRYKILKKWLLNILYRERLDSTNIFLNLLLFLSLYIDFIMAELFTDYIQSF